MARLLNFVCISLTLWGWIYCGWSKNQGHNARLQWRLTQILLHSIEIPHGLKRFVSISISLGPVLFPSLLYPFFGQCSFPWSNISIGWSALFIYLAAMVWFCNLSWQWTTHFGLKRVNKWIMMWFLPKTLLKKHLDIFASFLLVTSLISWLQILLLTKSKRSSCHT